MHHPAGSLPAEQMHPLEASSINENFICTDMQLNGVIKSHPCVNKNDNYNWFMYVSWNRRSSRSNDVNYWNYCLHIYIYICIVFFIFRLVKKRTRTQCATLLQIWRFRIQHQHLALSFRVSLYPQFQHLENSDDMLLNLHLVSNVSRETHNFALNPYLVDRPLPSLHGWQVPDQQMPHLKSSSTQAALLHLMSHLKLHGPQPAISMAS